MVAIKINIEPNPVATEISTMCVKRATAIALHTSERM